jgi:peptide/nickel transport system permease protein
MKNTIRILIKSPKFLVGFFILLTMLLIVNIVPMINNADPLVTVGMSFDSPTKEFILGTDNFGRDMFLELMYGIKTSIFVGLMAGGIATSIGLVIGLLCGYLGGIVDDLLTTITNVMMVIPSFIILILISVSLNSRTSLTTALIIGLTAWPWTARSVRAQTTSLRNRDHVNLAKISGNSTSRIILFEIVPYIMSYVFMAFILQTATGIMAEATISMLGLGPFNTISLGVMLNWAMQFGAQFNGSWWAYIPPAVSIALVTFSLFLINTGMDEIFNPKIRS